MKKILSMMHVDVNLMWGWYLLVTVISLGAAAVLFLIKLNSATDIQAAGAEIGMTLAQTVENSYFIWIFLAGLCVITCLPELVWIRKRKNDSHTEYLLCRLTTSRRQIFIAHAVFNFLLIVGYWGIFRILYLLLAGQYVTQMEAAGALGLNSQTIAGAGFEYRGLLSFLPVGMPRVLIRNLTMVGAVVTSEAAVTADISNNGGRTNITVILSRIWIMLCFLGEATEYMVQMIYIVLFIILMVAAVAAGLSADPKDS